MLPLALSGPPLVALQEEEMTMRALMPICLSLIAVSSNHALAAEFLGPLPYLQAADSPLDIASPGYVLQNMENGVFGGPGIGSNLFSGSIVGPGGLTDSVDGDDGSVNGSGTLGRSLFNIAGGNGVTITFDAAILGSLPTEAGIVWTDGAGSTLFEAWGPDNLPLGTIGPVSIADASVSGTTGEDRFFGVRDRGGILKIRISNSAGGIEVDHFQFTLGGGCSASPDFNRDGLVNAADLAILLGGWGSCPRTGCCTGDLDANGQVGAPDLAILLGAWTV